MRRRYLLFIVFLTTAYSCKTTKINSLAMIGHDYEHIKNHLNDGFPINEDPYFKFYETKDSLLVISSLYNNPYESLFLFKNDTCYYQQLRVHCSPCADKMIEAISRDKNYKFKAIDAINHLSQVNPNIILRLKETLDDEGYCNEITIHKINN